MSDVQQSRFEGWAVVDVMGHQRYVGYVTTEAYGQVVLFRIDVPALDARERETQAPGWVGDKYCPPGTKVQEGPVDGYTKLVGPGSIYMISPCTKEAALAAVQTMQPRPVMKLQLPPAADVRELPAVLEGNFPSEMDDDDRDGEEGES